MRAPGVGSSALPATSAHLVPRGLCRRVRPSLGGQALSQSEHDRAKRLPLRPLLCPSGSPPSSPTETFGSRVFQPLLFSLSQFPFGLAAFSEMLGESSLWCHTALAPALAASSDLWVRVCVRKRDSRRLGPRPRGLVLAVGPSALLVAGRRMQVRRLAQACLLRGHVKALSWTDQPPGGCRCSEIATLPDQPVQAPRRCGTAESPRCQGPGF